jgi:hypothetical protein
MAEGRKRRLSRRGLFIAALVLFTASNVFIQTLRASGDPVSVTTMDRGDRVSDFEVTNIATTDATGETLLVPGVCQLVVVFSATCPFCHKSAINEQRYAKDGGARLPTTWVTDVQDEAALEFQELVAPESRVVYAEDALDKLDVQAVPAGIIVGADGTVIDQFAYTGTEDHQAMAAQCVA